ESIPLDVCLLPVLCPAPARARLSHRVRVARRAAHGARGRARNPSRRGLPRPGPRDVRGRGLPPLAHALLAGRRRRRAPAARVGRGRTVAARDRRGRASGEPTWRNRTALHYPFWTQPLPPWTAWYAQWLPEWTHRAMTLGMFAIELGVPWLVLAPPRFRRLRLAACALLVLGQLGIAVTGNYGFFNLLSLTLCVPLLDDAVLRRAIPLRLAAGAPEPRWKRVGVTAFEPVVALLTALAFVREIAATLPGGGSLDHALLRAVAPLRSINGYGLFRVMTTERPEIVIEGSRDGVSWKEYEFRWKPGALTRRPRFSQPHMPRLDWQMWFAALNPQGAR